uniref:Tudor domain-containing protein n=1 Tax=Glossina pallidipes TaxID=7398 RepID=A0A1A9ZIL4_GLOPL
MEKKSLVVVTHFINPHLFWYHKVDDFRGLDEIEQQLQLIPKTDLARSSNYYPKLGEKIAVHFVSWNKIVRAKVLREAKWQNEFFVWALDYGFPFRTKRKYIQHLPTKLASQTNRIQCGGLANILPAEIAYDYMESNSAETGKDNWRQSACDVLEKLLRDAVSIIFVEQFQSIDNRHWGNLIMTNQKGKVFNAREHLLSAKFAIEKAMKFQDICLKLTTVLIPKFRSNNWKLALKANIITENKIEGWHTRNKRQNVLIDAKSVTKSNISQDDSMPKNFNSSGSKSKRVEVGIINNYIGKCATLVKKKAAPDNLKKLRDEDFIVKNKTTSEGNWSPDIPNASCVSTQKLLKLRHEDVHGEEDYSKDGSRNTSDITSHSSPIAKRYQQLMELRSKYKEDGAHVKNSSFLGTSVPSFTNHNKTLDVKRTKPTLRKVRIAVDSFSSMKHQKYESLQQASFPNHNKPRQPTHQSYIKSSKSDLSASYVHSDIKKDKENVRQNSIKTGSEISSNVFSVNNTRGEQEKLANSRMLKPTNEVNPRNVKKNLKSPFYDPILAPVDFNVSGLTIYRNEEHGWRQIKTTKFDKLTKNTEMKKEVFVKKQKKSSSLEGILSKKPQESAKKRTNFLGEDSVTMSDKHGKDDFVKERKNTRTKQSPTWMIAKSIRI